MYLHTLYTVQIVEVERTGSDLHRKLVESVPFHTEMEALNYALDNTFHRQGGGWRQATIDRLPVRGKH